MLLSNLDAEFTCQLDGTFVSFEGLRERVRLIEGAKEGHLELEGAPDMVLEVVSASSVQKDTVELRERYWKAGIAEYWLVDARGKRLAFDILRHTAKGYVATRRQGGWLRSAVFGRSFRLTRQDDPLGNPEYSLEIR
ncbi:MAG: Uma2 family endonuclease [Gemmataceae bacterium]|nr:Uma2 family endonuclease [Gemmataceae bacterium]